MSNAKKKQNVTLEIVENELRAELTALYETYLVRYKDFVTSRMRQLSSGARISTEEFVAEIGAISKQLLVEDEHMFEMCAFSQEDFEMWKSAEQTPHERVRNEVLIIVYEVLLTAMEDDSERESARLLAFRDVLGPLSVQVK